MTNAFLSPEWFTVIAGQTVVDAIGARRPTGTEPDRELCRRQEQEHSEGFEGVEVGPSMYGWSVRYDSGLNGFNLVASSRYGSLDGTRADAIRFATEWVSKNPARRYAWIRKEHETMHERWPYGERR